MNETPTPTKSAYQFKSRMWPFKETEDLLFTFSKINVHSPVDLMPAPLGARFPTCAVPSEKLTAFC